MATLPATGSASAFVFPRFVRFLIFFPRSIFLKAVPQQIIINFEAVPLGIEIAKASLTLENS
jgi:hypothetical protein